MPKKTDGTSEPGTLADLQPDPDNANRGTARGSAMLEESLRRYGAGRSLVVDRRGVVIGGNKTLAAAHRAGLTRTIVVPTTGEDVVVVQRTDLDLATDPRAKELALADNRVQEVSLEWDPEALQRLAASGADLGPLWTHDELARVLRPAGAIADPGAQLDRAAELQAQWQTARGQLWQIGRHRLCCGDATDASDVSRLLGEARPRLMVTDPPYGVEYDPAWRNEAAAKGLIAFAASREGNVRNDETVNWAPAWALSPTDVAYVWHAGRHASEVQAGLQSAAFEVRAQIIWAKAGFAISRGHYHWQHEPCWYAVRRDASAHWIGDRSQTTLWSIGLDDNVAGGHATQKPVECMARPIRNHAGDVYDPFVGSGTTLVAAEGLGRRGYAMEIDPGYVAVTVERLAGLGLKPERVDGR